MKEEKDHKDNTRHCHGALRICHACSSAFFCDGKCFKGGLGFYLKAISTSYVLSALKVTLIATVFAVVINTFFGIWTAWLLTRFSFKGKQVLATLIDIPFSISPVIVGLAYLMTFGRLGWFYPVIRWFNEIFGTNVRITFAIPGVVLATIFVTFPYVSREIIPVLNAEERMRKKPQR